MGLFMLFGILWILAFIDYTSRFIVMASAVTYYFNSNAEKDGSAELGYAIKIAHLNHAGSIAFGSFIIAVVQFIELVFMYFAKKAEQAGGDN
jgi:choline transporter-like protein 2/4/5